MKTIWTNSAGSNFLELCIILSVLIALFLLVKLIHAIQLHTKAERELAEVRAIIEKHNAEVLHIHGHY